MSCASSELDFDDESPELDPEEEDDEYGAFCIGIDIWGIIMKDIGFWYCIFFLLF